jgi:predicted ArsR family transcriptional regulator
VYARSATEFAVTVPPREYELAARLLAGAVAADAAGACRDALRDAARRHGQALAAAARPARGSGSAEDLLGVLREHGFEPAGPPEGPVQLRNCPFRGLAAEHTRLVCGMNLALIGGVIEGLGCAGLRAALAPEPGCCCVVISAERG